MPRVKKLQTNNSYCNSANHTDLTFAKEFHQNENDSAKMEEKKRLDGCERCKKPSSTGLTQQKTKFVPKTEIKKVLSFVV